MSSKTESGKKRRISFPVVYYELIIAGFSMLMGMSLPSAFLPILAKSLDPSGLLVGLVISAWFLSRIFMELPAGIISDRIGRRRLLIFGIGFSALGPALCSQATNIYMLIVGRTVWGFGTAFYFMNNTALIIDLFPASGRGKALGLFQGVEFIGSFIGAPIGAFLASYMSYNQVFYFTFILTLASLMITAFSKNLKSTERKKSSSSGISLKQVFSSLRDWSIMNVCLCSFSRMFVMQGVFQTVFQLYLNDNLGLPIEYIGAITSARIAGQIVSVVTAGMLSDRLGRKPILMAGFLICASSLTAFTLISGLELLILVGLVEGLGEGFGMTTIIALLSDIAKPSVRGGAIGVYRTFMDLGGFLGPMAYMYAYSSLGAQSSFYLGIVVNLVSVVLIAFVKVGTDSA